MIPRTTLPTREMQNKVMNTLMEVYMSELPSHEPAPVVDAEIFNNRTV